ncbi:MAG: hypothetical protein R3A52_07565 [Polyangiales bacterium]
MERASTGPGAATGMAQRGQGETAPEATKGWPQRGQDTSIAGDGITAGLWPTAAGC